MEVGPSAESLRAVITKLARGHALYDLAAPQYESPTAVNWFRLDEVPTSDVETFDCCDDVTAGPYQLLPDVGSRGLLRMFDSKEVSRQRTWTIVQEGRYRYSSRVSDRLAIRLVLRGYLACEVTW